MKYKIIVWDDPVCFDPIVNYNKKLELLQYTDKPDYFNLKLSRLLIKLDILESQIDCEKYKILIKED